MDRPSTGLEQFTCGTLGRATRRGYMLLERRNGPRRPRDTDDDDDDDDILVLNSWVLFDCIQQDDDGETK